MMKSLTSCTIPTMYKNRKNNYTGPSVREMTDFFETSVENLETLMEAVQANLTKSMASKTT